VIVIRFGVRFPADGVIPLPSLFNFLSSIETGNRIRIEITTIINVCRKSRKNENSTRSNAIEMRSTISMSPSPIL
jgi:hypothetical protein